MRLHTSTPRRNCSVYPIYDFIIYIYIFFYYLLKTEESNTKKYFLKNVKLTFAILFQVTLSSS